MLLLCTLYYFPLVKQVSVTTTAAVMELLVTNKAVAKSGSSTASIRKKKKTILHGTTICLFKQDLLCRFYFGGQKEYSGERHVSFRV